MNKRKLNDVFDQLAGREARGEELSELERAILYHPNVPKVLYDQTKAERERLALIYENNLLAAVVSEQLAVQQKIFTLLNAYANKEHLEQYSRVDPHSILGQVYGDLAACFQKLENANKMLAKKEMVAKKGDKK